jgi:hypothetical protein
MTIATTLAILLLRRHRTRCGAVAVFARTVVWANVVTLPPSSATFP